MEGGSVVGVSSRWYSSGPYSFRIELAMCRLIGKICWWVKKCSARSSFRSVAKAQVYTLHETLSNRLGELVYV